MCVCVFEVRELSDEVKVRACVDDQAWLKLKDITAGQALLATGTKLRRSVLSIHATANMSYIGNASDVEQEKNLTEYRRQRSSSNLLPAGSKAVSSSKLSDVLWNDKRANQGNQTDDDDSEVSDSENFLAKGAFLLTPSHELSMDRAALICEKMNFKGCFSLTKTATGILFKFSNPEDYQAVFKKGFHKVTGARFYKKVAIPCRPQKTFMLYVFDVPDDVPVEDIRHSLYRFNSVVEVVRLVVHYQKQSNAQNDQEQMQAGTSKITLIDLQRRFSFFNYSNYRIRTHKTPHNLNIVNKIII